MPIKLLSFGNDVSTHELALKEIKRLHNRLEVVREVAIKEIKRLQDANKRKGGIIFSPQRWEIDPKTVTETVIGVDALQELRTLADKREDAQGRLDSWKKTVTETIGVMDEEMIVRIYADGDEICALIGPNIMDGIAGFGKTAGAALRELANQVDLEKEKASHISYPWTRLVDTSQKFKDDTGKVCTLADKVDYYQKLKEEKWER